MVSWEFVEEALMGYGFPTSFIHFIMTCVTSPMFTVKINGKGMDFLLEKGDSDKAIPYLHYFLCFSWSICQEH